jgi:predicted acyltransferase
VAITLAFSSRTIDSALLRRIVRRTILLFVLGLLLNAVPAFDLVHLRVPGVLQRFALCYLVASLVFLITGVEGQAALLVGLLIAYWLLLTWVPVPGIGPGVLEPETNLGAWLDRRLLDGHLGRGSWDPEGLLSTIPAIATTLMGVLAGHWMRGARSTVAKSGGLIAAGAAGIAAGEWLGRWFPINKSLWTSSYAVFMGGIAALLLGCCLWLVDIRDHRRLAAPFVVFGSNPIVLYVLATLGAKLLDAVTITRRDGTAESLHALVYERAFVPWAGPTAGSTLFAVALVGIWFAPMTFLYRRGLFVKV